MKAVFHGLNYFYLSLAAYVKASMIRFWKKGGTAPDYYLATSSYFFFFFFLPPSP